jgi:hypothetical protein
MEDMRKLNDMGAIDDDYMKELEREWSKAQEDCQPEKFLQEATDCKYSHPRHGSKATKQPLAKNKLKRMRKAQKQARKMQRA